MTRKEMENRIRNLEESLATLAEKSYDKDSDNEKRISSVSSEVDQQSIDIADIEESSNTLYEIEADQEFRICCLEMGMSPDDFDETV